MIDPRLIEAEALQSDDWAVQVAFPWAVVVPVAAVAALAAIVGMSIVAGWL